MTNLLCVSAVVATANGSSGMPACAVRFRIWDSGFRVQGLGLRA